MGRFGAKLIVSIIAIAALVPVGTSSAQAQTKRVLLLPLSADFLDPSLVRQLDKELRDEVSQAMPDYLVLPRPALDLTSMKVAAGCATDGPRCLALIGRTAQAVYVLQVTLRGSPRKARLFVRQVDARPNRRSTKYEAELVDVGPASNRELRWHLATALGAKPPPLMGRISLVPGRANGLRGARILLDDRQVPLAALDQVNPGQHRLEVQRDGYQTFTWMGSIRPGRDTAIQLPTVALRDPARRRAIDPAAPSVAAVESSSSPVWGWILGAGAVVAAGTATVFAVQVLDLEKDAEEADLQCDAEDENNSVCEDGRSRALLTNITWGVAGALAVGSLVAFLVETSGDDGETASTRVGVAPTRDGVSAAVQVSF